jgi:raffinose/stachyose/melibiose transport system permease protein
VKKSAKRIPFYLFIITLGAIWLIPVFFIFVTAIKSPADFYGKPIFSLPTQLRWDNFFAAWVKGRMSLYMKNGIIVCFLKVPLGILVSSLTAFALTRLKIKFSNILFLVFLAGMMIPAQVTLVPLNIAMTRLKLVNTYLGLFVVYMGFGLPFGVLVMRGFFRSIPNEIDESAKIDGCTNLRLYLNILMPIAKPAAATLFIMDFLSTWNEYMLASILITDIKMRTVPTGLLSFVDEVGVDYGLLTAGVLISILPIFIVYIACQRYFVEGLSGAIKG